MPTYEELQRRKEKLEEEITRLEKQVNDPRNKGIVDKLTRRLETAKEQLKEVLQAIEDLEGGQASLNESKMEVFKYRNLTENLRKKVESDYKNFYAENGKRHDTMSSISSTSVEINGVPPAQEIRVDAALTKNI